MSLFHNQTPGTISTKFYTDFHTNTGKVLNTSLTWPTQPPDPWVPQTSKPIQITGEKTLLQKNALNFSRAMRGLGWQVLTLITTKRD